MFNLDACADAAEGHTIPEESIRKRRSSVQPNTAQAVPSVQFGPGNVDEYDIGNDDRHSGDDYNCAA